MLVGSPGLPPPTTMGQINSWHSSTSPALKACVARLAPPTVRSLLAVAFSSCTAAGSKRRSSRVAAVDNAGRDVGYTALLPPRPGAPEIALGAGGRALAAP